MRKILAILTVGMLLVTTAAFAQTTSAQTFNITLTENPTTGYTWNVTIGDDAIVTLSDQGYTADEAPEGMVGTGGTHSWITAGKAAGSTDVTFVLGQQWEGGLKEDTIVYTCTVDDQLNVTATLSQGVPEKYWPNDAVVELKENQTTGYQWKFTADPDGILALEKDEYLTDSSDTKEGAGGIHRWIFHGASAGDVTLTFTYVREWEKDEKPAATVTFTYQVDDQGRVTQKQVDGDFSEYAVDAVSGATKN